MNTFIDTILTPFVAFLLEWSLRWFVVAALPILWLWLRPPREPRLRYQICLATLAAGLLLPVLPRWGGLVPLQPAAVTHHEDPLEGELPSQVSAAPALLSPRTPTEPAPAIANEIVVPPEAIVVHETPVSEPIDWRPILIRWVTFVTASAWLVGVLVLVVRWIAGSLYLRQLRRTAVDADAAVIEVFASCGRELRVSRTVRIAFHPGVASPLLIGPRSRTILLPSSWSQLSPALQRASLLHELAHVVRRDDWMALALRLADLPLFFHPCYRWLRNRLECEREICCDDLVLASGTDATDYAQMLRDFARQPSRFRSASPAIPFGHATTVKARIQHILENKMLPRISSTGWIWICGALLVPFLAGIGSLRIYAAITPESQVAREQEQTKKGVEQSATPLVPKEQLTFGGKGFEDWLQILRADLKPEVRAEAFQALSTFGKNGYANEATQAILEIAKTYNPIANDREDHSVVEAASKELCRLGSAASPALAEELQHGQTNGRRVAALVFRQMNQAAKPAVPALERALQDEDAYVRGQVALSLANCSELKNPAGLKCLQEVVTSIAKLNSPLPPGYKLKDATDALTELSRQGKAARAVIPDLMEVLIQRPERNTQELSGRTLATILSIGGDAKTMVPAYLYQLRNGIQPVTESLDKLGEAGSEGKAAAPFLVSRFHQPRIPAREKYQIAEVLLKIGADPKDLVPILQELVKRRSDPGSFGTLEEARAANAPLRTEQLRLFREYLEKHAPESQEPQSVWTQEGMLERTAVIDSSGARFYRLTYAGLEKVGTLYCVAGPGVDLDAQCNKPVRLFGVMGYHTLMKQDFMRVSHVKAAPTEAAREKPHSD